MAGTYRRTKILERDNSHCNSIDLVHPVQRTVHCLVLLYYIQTKVWGLKESESLINNILVINKLVLLHDFNFLFEFQVVHSNVRMISNTQYIILMLKIWLIFLKDKDFMSIFNTFWVLENMLHFISLIIITEQIGIIYYYFAQLIFFKTYFSFLA